MTGDCNVFWNWTDSSNWEEARDGAVRLCSEQASKFKRPDCHLFDANGEKCHPLDAVWNHSRGRYDWDFLEGKEGEKHAAPEPPAPFTPVEVMPWKEAKKLASDLVLFKLSDEEKVSLLHGTDGSGGRHHYVGETGGIAAHGIPVLRMQDGPSGFRPTSPGEEGTTTQWPSMLALAATWDEELVESVGQAVGREFRGKGANALLGPDLNVVRSPRGGRNFDFLPGEDPHLGARLAPRYIRGVQSQGVMAVAKGFAFAGQESGKSSMDAAVDSQTAWEVHYPPFVAAVDAGVSAIMCAGNKVDGDYACENANLLKRDLKEAMGFEGFVMSSWLGTRSAEAIDAGLDMEMPTARWFTEEHLLGGDDGDHSMSVNEAAVRVVASIYHARLHEQRQCEAPCGAERRSNQRGSQGFAHMDVALDAARKSIVLLKNDGILPLRSAEIGTVAVLGWAAGAHDVKNFALGSPYGGGGSSHVVSPELLTPLMSAKVHGLINGTKVLHYGGFDMSEAKSIASQADVVIVFAAALSREGADRPHLNLGWGADHLIESVAPLKPTVVLMQAPGAVLTPWRDRVSAVATMFLGGEKTADAWTDVIFGEVAPTGKLPITFPASETDVLDSEAAFPFGHGLTYTTFEHRRPKLLNPSDCEVLRLLVPVHNTGAFDGESVVQAYVNFTGSERSLPLMLKGFIRTGNISKSKVHEVLISFTERDVSLFKADVGFVQESTFEVHLGASSADIAHVVLVDGGSASLVAEGGKAIDPVDLEMSNSNMYNTSGSHHCNGTDHHKAAAPWEQLAGTIGDLIHKVVPR